MAHIPVLLKETIELLDPQPNENFVDATFGRGGHSKALLEKIAPNGIVIGLDWDLESLKSLKNENQDKLGKRLIVEHLNFARVGSAKGLAKAEKIDGIIFDLGMSSWHIDESAKGFSFSKDEPLDMRYDSLNPISASEIINEWPVEKLREIFENYGEEKQARKIAFEIAKAREQKKIETAPQLAAIIAKNVSARFGKSSLARLFQALRIAVNDELGNIEQGMDQGFELLAGGGRMAVISFHSIEDRIVKNKFREWVSEGRAKLINAKPIIPGDGEQRLNPRSRSAKLRVIKKIA